MSNVIFPSRDQMIEDLVTAQVEAEMDSDIGTTLTDLLTNGCPGYKSLSNAQLEEEWLEFIGFAE